VSHFKKIETEFKTGASLVQALKDLGYTPRVAPDLKVNGLVARDFYGHELPCAVKVFKQEFGGFTDLGFAWDEASKTYSAAVDNWDAYSESQTGKLNAIKQRYAVNEAKRLARLQGYSLQEQALPDGSVRLVCTSYAGGY
jgi:hypothetical protein